MRGGLDGWVELNMVLLEWWIWT